MSDIEFCKSVISLIFVDAAPPLEAKPPAFLEHHGKPEAFRKGSGKAAKRLTALAVFG